MRSMRGVVDAGSRTETLTKQNQTGVSRDRAAEKIAHRRIDIRLESGEGWHPIGRPVAAIVQQQDVEASRRQPMDTGDVGADVLGVAVQK